MEITQLLAGCTLHWKFDCFGTIKNDVSQLDLQECTAVTIVTCKTVRGIHTRFPLPSVFAQSWKNIFKKTSESTLFHNVIRTRHSPKKKKCL